MSRKSKQYLDRIRRDMRILLEMGNNEPMLAMFIAKHLDCSTRLIAVYVKKWPEFAWIEKNHFRFYYLK